MKYVRVSKSRLISTWLKKLWVISTAPTTPYPAPQERWLGLEFLPGPSDSVSPPNSSITVYSTSRAVQFAPPKT